MAAFDRPEQLTDAFAEKLNAKDPAALGELFTEDAEFVNIMGMRMRGRQGIDAGTTRTAAPCPTPRGEIRSLPIDRTAAASAIHAGCQRARPLGSSELDPSRREDRAGGAAPVRRDLRATAVAAAGWGRSCLPIKGTRSVPSPESDGNNSVTIRPSLTTECARTAPIGGALGCGTCASPAAAAPDWCCLSSARRGSR